MGTIEYHLKELDIALSKDDERRIVPSILDSDRIILDIGCGVGQTLLALDCTGITCVGLDIDEDAIRYGIEQYGGKIQFILGRAERIPLPSDTFNLVYSRVSLPYTNIPKVIKEIRRVLRKDGRIWMTLHGRTMIDRYFREAVMSRRFKRLIHVIYILINGYLLKYLGLVIPYINGRYESWQDPSAMKRLLIRNGFSADAHEVGKHTVVEGRLIEKP